MEKEILIEGMHCNHCVDAVKKALSEIDGVSHVEVDLKKNIAVVDVENVDDGVLADAIDSIGFEGNNEQPENPDKPYIPNANGHEYVDLGLPSGTLWATMNVGATSAVDYGYYFCWGETTPRTTEYKVSDYKLYEGESLDLNNLVFSLLTTR